MWSVTCPTGLFPKEQFLTRPILVANQRVAIPGLHGKQRRGGGGVPLYPPRRPSLPSHGHIIRGGGWPTPPLILELGHLPFPRITALIMAKGGGSGGQHWTKLIGGKLEPLLLQTISFLFPGFRSTSLRFRWHGEFYGPLGMALRQLCVDSKHPTRADLIAACGAEVLELVEIDRRLGLWADGNGWP